MKKFLIALIAMFVLAVIPTALAMSVEIKDTSSGQVSVVAGETIPVKVTSVFSANYSDVVLEVQLKYSHGKKVEVDTKAMDVISGKTYVQNIELKVPENIDATVSGDTYTISLVMKDKNGRTIDSATVDVSVQRENDVLEIQKVMTGYAKAGQPTIVTVVVKNTGSDNQDDAYVKVSIPELNLIAEERLGDIASVDDGEDEDVSVADIPLRIPEDAEDGVYTMVVEVSNDNIKVEAMKEINIDGMPNKGKFVEVVPSLTSQEIAQGETVIYTLRIANLGDSSESYEVYVEGTEGWSTYQVNPLTLALSAESNQIITIGITASKDALVGEHAFTAKVVSSKATKTIPLTANVKESTGINAMLISVIVLAIVLVILIALLVKTRKATEGTEAEESYY